MDVSFSEDDFGEKSGTLRGNTAPPMLLMVGERVTGGKNTNFVDFGWKNELLSLTLNVNA